MKIFFVDNIQNIKEDYFDYSTGLLSLATIVKKAGHRVEILNFNYLFNKEILKYSLNSVENFENIVNYIIAEKPDILGFTVMCNSFHNSILLAKLIKERDDSIKIIMGGPHVSIFPERILEQFSDVDLISVGEGENNVLDIIKGLKEDKLEDVPAIVYRKDGMILRNKDMDIIENLDELPFLDYELIPYFDKCSNIAIEAGRGCPFRCTYCSTSGFWKHKFRMKSVDRIIKEVLYVKNIIGKRKVLFDFIHDNFTSNRKFIMNLCEKIRDLDINWFCSARVDCLDEDLILELASSGCREVYMGIETGSPSIQKDINKKLNLDRIYEVIKSLEKNKISPIVSFMYGFPTEKEEDLEMTLNMIYSLLKRGVYECQVHSLCVLAGTKIYDEYKDRLILKDFYSDIADPSNLELSMPLIKKNKDLFSHFYIMEDSLVDRYYLLDKFVFYIVISLYKYFHKTIDYILKIFDGSIFAFYKDFIISSDGSFVNFFKSGEYVKDYIEYVEIIEKMVDFFESYINRKVNFPRFNIVFNKFNLENFKFRMKYHPSLPKIRG